jgi:hypothetical protein
LARRARPTTTRSQNSSFEQTKKSEIGICILSTSVGLFHGKWFQILISFLYLFSELLIKQPGFHYHFPSKLIPQTDKRIHNPPPATYLGRRRRRQFQLCVGQIQKNKNIIQSIIFENIE